MEQPLRARGDSFTLSVTNGPAEAATAIVKLGHVRDGQKVQIDNPKYIPATGGDSARVTGTIGPTVVLGGYLIDLVLKDTTCTAADPQQLVTVAPPGNPELHLDKFDPDYSYGGRTLLIKKAPSDASNGSDGSDGSDGVKTRVTDLVLRGHGFQPNLTDNLILINSVPTTLAPGDCSTADSDETRVAGPIAAQVVSDREIDLCAVPVPENGQFRVQIAVGDHLSEQQVFHVYKYGKMQVGLTSAIIALILALLPLFLLSWVKGSYTISDQTYKLRLLFLDPETDSYSLSKLQFYLWTVAALFSYAYLFISRVMVQNTVWPDIPENLPGVIAVAAGTSISSQFITSSKGSKGAGPIQPGFADFITSGGVVAPDRVQMLLWTLFGVGAFLIATLGDSPGAIKSLPTVPEHLLYLMGLSSAGYLGGKLARKAGPVINEISVSPTDPDDAIIGAAAALAIPRIARTITIRGSTLSAEALLQFDHVDLPFRMLTNSQGQQAPEIVSREDSNPSFARVMQLRIDPVNLGDSDFRQFRAWFGTKGTHTLTLTNPDGQMAEASFPVPPGEGQKSGTAA